MTDKQREAAVKHITEQTMNVNNVIAKHVGKYNNLYVIIRLILGRLFNDGFAYYKNMTDAEQLALVAEMNAPQEDAVDENGHAVTYIKVTTEELDHDIISCCRELAQMDSMAVALFASLCSL